MISNCLLDFLQIVPEKKNPAIYNLGKFPNYTLESAKILITID